MSGRRRGIVVLALLVAALSSALAAGVLHRVRPVAITLGQRTLILRDMTDPEARAQLRLHEAVHRMQFRRHGLIRFLFLYAFDSDQRLRWEAEASAACLCTLRDGGGFLLEAAAAAQVDALRRYAVVGAIPEPVARAHLDGAFRDGTACPRLLRRAAARKVDSVHVLRTGADDLADDLIEGVSGL